MGFLKTLCNSALKVIVPGGIGFGASWGAFKMAEKLTGLHGAPMVTATLKNIGHGDMHRGVGVLIAWGIGTSVVADAAISEVCDWAEGKWENATEEEQFLPDSNDN